MLISFNSSPLYQLTEQSAFIFDDKSVALFFCFFCSFTSKMRFFICHSFFSLYWISWAREHTSTRRKRRKIYASTPKSCRVFRSTAVNFQAVNKRREEKKMWNKYAFFLLNLTKRNHVLWVHVSSMTGICGVWARARPFFARSFTHSCDFQFWTWIFFLFVLWMHWSYRRMRATTNASERM